VTDWRVRMDKGVRSLERQSYRELEYKLSVFMTLCFSTGRTELNVYMLYSLWKGINFNERWGKQADHTLGWRILRYLKCQWF